MRPWPASCSAQTRRVRGGAGGGRGGEARGGMGTLPSQRRGAAFGGWRRCRGGGSARRWEPHRCHSCPPPSCCPGPRPRPAGCAGAAGRHRAGGLSPALPRPGAEPAGLCNDGPQASQGGLAACGECGRRGRRAVLPAEYCPASEWLRLVRAWREGHAQQAGTRQNQPCLWSPCQPCAAAPPSVPPLLQPQAVLAAAADAAGPHPAARHLAVWLDCRPGGAAAQCGARHAAARRGLIYAARWLPPSYLSALCIYLSQPHVSQLIEDRPM